MLGSTKKNIAISGAAMVILCAAAGTSAIYNDRNSSISIESAPVSTHVTEYTQETAYSVADIQSEDDAEIAVHATPGGTVVYVSSSGKYHSKSDCSGMKRYNVMDLDEAISAGHSPCGRCFTESYSESTEAIETIHTATNDIPGTNVYVSSSGKYHTKPDCSGMKNYTEMVLDDAVESGYDACKKCADSIA